MSSAGPHIVSARGVGHKHEAAMDATKVRDAGGIDANLAPDAFHRWATHYYQCRQTFDVPHPFSPVPYFLLCRAIELELKSRHLAEKKQSEVEREFGHHLDRAYAALNSSDQILSPGEQEILQQASSIYAPKGFEYFDPKDTLNGYRRYPDISGLDGVAKKLLGM